MLIPVFAVGTAFIAAVTDPSSGADLVLCGLAAAPFLVWAFMRGVPLLALSLVVVVPAVVAQRSGQLEPLLFEVSLLAFVIGRSASSTTESVALGLLALLAPVVATLIQDPPEISTGIWIIGIAFPWVFGRAAGRQGELVAQLKATRRELAQQALLVERRRIARDVHDFVGHGLAAVMLQVTSARHVLHRDPALNVGDGRASLTAETTGPTVAAPAGEPERTCYGLIGMRERAAALGGELTAGPTPDGWRVTCTLPPEAKDALPVSDGGGR